MTERRFNDPRRGGNRYGGGRPDESSQPARPEPKRDPGAYIGRMPERSTGSAQGGFAPRDRRDNSPAPQPIPATAPVQATPATDSPGTPASDAQAQPGTATAPETGQGS